MNTCNSNGLVVLCSWVPDSQAAPALRNDRNFGVSCPASPLFRPSCARFKRGQSGNPSGRSTKSLPALLADALNETVVVTIDGRRRKLTKREAMVTQRVDKSASEICARPRC